LNKPPACSGQTGGLSNVLLLLAVLSFPASAAVDFARDVHPILAARCFTCHGGDKRSGGLSLQAYSDVLKGGRSGPAIVPGHSADSLLLQRVTATTSRMPAAGPPLSPDEIATVKAWIDEGARESATSAAARTPWIAKLELHKPEIPAGPAGNAIDRFIAAYSKQYGISLPPAIGDRAFARRAYLDIWGLLPLPAQLEEFDKQTEPDKRARLLAKLLGDHRNYTEHWISFWNDLLRNDEGVTYSGTRKTITPWLYEALRQNMPYDRFVQKLLDPTAPKDPDGFLLGVNWRGDVSASQSPVMQAAQNSAQVFLGVNLKCNSCHDSFISKWKLKDAYGLAAYFTDADQLELVRCDAKTGQFTGAKFLYPELQGSEPVTTPAERKAAAARMFTDPRDGRMPRTIVNRIWARLLGHGLVEDVDEMDGEPWSPELLDWLAADFVEHGYDLKHLIATIVTSRAYQLPAVHRDSKQVKDYVFRGPEVRRLTAEEFVDSLSEITGEWPVFTTNTQGVYARQWRTPSTLLTRGLGRPIRDQVYTERNEDATTLQALELVNGEILTHMLARGAKRMLGELPPAPANLYDSGRLTGNTDTSTLQRRMTAKQRIVDIDLTGVRELRLLTTDAGSSSPERVVPVWIDPVLVGPGGEATLASLTPLSGRATKAVVKSGGEVHSTVLITPLPTQLVYDIAGKGYTRFRAIVGFDDQCLQNDIGPAVRFFIFQEKPDPERLVHVEPGTPVEPPLSMPFTENQLISTVFEYMLGRQPSAQERKLASAMVAPANKSMKAQGVADLLWAVAMQPEYQFIY